VIEIVSKYGGELDIKGPNGDTVATVSSTHPGGFGIVTVRGPTGEVRAGMLAGDKGGKIELFPLSGWRSGEKQMAAVSLGVGANGGTLSVFGKDNLASKVLLGVSEYGNGTVAVFAKGDSKARGHLKVDRYGNGEVVTWDKNGYLLP
jgi:hypothetical protein